MDNEPAGHIVDETDPKKPIVKIDPHRSGRFLEWLIMISIKHDDVKKAFPDPKDFETAQIQLIVNGVAIDVMPAINAMRDQYDSLVEGTAKMMLEERVGERFEKLQRMLSDFESELKSEARLLFPKAVFEED